MSRVAASHGDLDHGQPGRRGWSSLLVLAVVFTLVGTLLPSPLRWVASKIFTPRMSMDSLVAMEWGGGQYGPRMYGACVFTVPSSSGVDVRAEVWIDGEDYRHDCGVIGTANDLRDARDKFGTITFDASGVSAGDGATMKLIAAKGTYDEHR